MVLPLTKVFDMPEQTMNLWGDGQGLLVKFLDMEKKKLKPFIFERRLTGASLKVMHTWTTELNASKSLT